MERQNTDLNPKYVHLSSEVQAFDKFYFVRLHDLTIQDRHSGMNSHQAILPDTLRVNANLFQTDLRRNPSSMDGFKLTNHGTAYPLPGEYDELSYNELIIHEEHRRLQGCRR